jgi:hypothetical protein
MNAGLPAPVDSQSASIERTRRLGRLDRAISMDMGIVRMRKMRR